jgi:hypothetical protein
MPSDQARARDDNDEPKQSAPETRDPGGGSERPPEEPAQPARARESERPAEEKDAQRRNRFETLLPGLIRRGIEKGIEAGLSTFEKSLETGRETTGAVREVLSEVKAPRDVAVAVGKALSEAKLPREIASAVFTQIDDTKNDVLRIMAREFREFLEATDLANELKAALTSLSFEIRTEVRFIPNSEGTGVKPDVRARTRMKRDAAPERERRRRVRQRRQKDEQPENPGDDEGDDEI